MNSDVTIESPKRFSGCTFAATAPPLHVHLPRGPDPGSSPALAPEHTIVSSDTNYRAAEAATSPRCTIPQRRLSPDAYDFGNGATLTPWFSARVACNCRRNALAASNSQIQFALSNDDRPLMAVRLSITLVNGRVPDQPGVIQTTLF